MAQKIIAADGSVYVKKKPFYLRWWFITLVILVLLGGCASMMGGGSSKSTSASASSSSATADSSAVAEASQESNGDSSSAATSESNSKQNDNSIPSEYKSALKKAESYSRTMHMSKQGIYNQLTSEFEKFTPEAAQYAVDNVKADWNANALEMAKSYQQEGISRGEIRSHLNSDEVGFTENEAEYAISHLD